MQQTTTNTLLLLTIANHAAWSTLHVSARYLQVYAEPATFDGQGVLSSTKGFAALFLFAWGAITARIEATSNEQKNDGSDEPSDTSDAPMQREQQPNLEQSTLRKQQLLYTLAFAFVATTRASSNIASAAYTYPYNITLIASLTPVIIALFDRYLLQSPFPPLLWQTIFLSGVGSLLIAISQSIDSHDKHGKAIPTTDNLIGCSLQLLSAVFSAFARILMKQTQDILTPTHIVQTNNVSNCLIPFIYTIIHNPNSWGAFRYLLPNPKSLLAWCAISIGVYSFASTLQIRLVRKLGPGYYSSWAAVRVLGSVILSTFILGEGIQSWLEWTGIGIMIVTISVYLVKSQQWMEERKKQEENVQRGADGEEADGNEELVSVSKEKSPLLRGAVPCPLKGGGGLQ